MKELSAAKVVDGLSICVDEPDSWPMRHALATLPQGNSPASLFAMFADWQAHLAMSPDKHMGLAQAAASHRLNWLAHACPEDAVKCLIALTRFDRCFLAAGWTNCSPLRTGLKPPRWKRAVGGPSRRHGWQTCQTSAGHPRQPKTRWPRRRAPMC